MDPTPHSDGELARPRPRLGLGEYLHRTVSWIGPRRIAGSLVVAVAVGVGGWWLLHAPPPPVERSLPRATTSVAPSTTNAVVAANGPAASGPAVVVVHVAGAVGRPGLVSLPAPARVADAVTAAGGITADADLDAVNLAAPIVDGTRLYVPRHGEIAPGGVVATPSGPPEPVGTAGTAGGLVDVNTASAAQLESLPGIGPATAAAIIAHREANGPFRSVDDMLDVRGIGPAKLAQFRDLVRV